MICVKKGIFLNNKMNLYRIYFVIKTNNYKLCQN